MNPGNTEIIKGVENILDITLQALPQIKKSADNCIDSTGPSSFVRVEPIWKGFIECKSRGVKLRFITEITKENITACKKMMETAELRHLEGVKGNFGIIDGMEYRASAQYQGKGQPPAELIRSTSTEFVKQQQYFFDTLWERAVPAEQKIREIEEGIPPQKTEVWEGVDNTIQSTLRCIVNVKERLDLCGDRNVVSVNITTEPIKNAYVEMVRRGVKMRVVTEITRENKHYCKEMMKFAEVRHLEGIKGNFGVSEHDYIGNATAQEAQPLPRLVYSTVRPFVEQQQFLFQTLWDKGIPAEQRIREIEEGLPIEKTEVWNGIEKGIEETLRYTSMVKERLDVCGDSATASVHVTTEPVWNAYLALKNRGVRIRWVTEITRENLHYCKELMKSGEVRHLEGIKGNFGVSENDYIATATHQEAQPHVQLVHSNVRPFVEQQKYVFQTLWDKAIPAEQRIKEIEDGVIPEKTEVIKGAENIINLTLQAEATIKKKLDNCIDSGGPASFVRVEPMRDAMIRLGRRGVKLRFITEITGDNIPYCREMMKVAELRHLDGITGNFGIMDGIEYRSSARVEPGQAPSELVRSTVRQFVEQQQLFFETLWDKAIPADQRIREIEEGLPPQKTEVLQGAQNIINVSLKCFAAVKQSHDSCGNHSLPSLIITTESVKNAFIELKKRGIKTRFITEITGANIDYCKELAKIVDELRHLDDVKGNFGVSESDYIGSASLSEATPLTQAIHSNVKAVIEQQQYLFETLWSKAIPADQKIKEIEQGIPPRRTEVLHGTDDLINLSLQCISAVKKRLDLCGDHKSPSLVMTTEPIKNGYIEISRKGASIRYITEVTRDNIPYCKELMKFTDLRHLEGIKGNFGVSEEAGFMAFTTPDEGQPLVELVYSNVKNVVEQQEYVFETLWNRAIPAEQKIKEIEEGKEPEKTEVVYGVENVIARSLQVLSTTKEVLDLCGDRYGPAVILAAEHVHKKYIELKKRGVRIRQIIEITKDNIEGTRKMMEFSETRHLDGLKGYFAIVDSRLFASNLSDPEGKSLPHVIVSTVKGLAEQQQYFFNTLWEMAIPAEQKIREIEEGIKPDIIEIIRDPYEVQKRASELAIAAKEELLIIFSTANAFHRQELVGLIQLLKEKAQDPRLKIMILTPADNKIDRIARELKEHFQNIDFRFIDSPLQTKVSILIVDRAYSLAVEVKDDTKETSIEAMGLATYSNSKATVFSYISVFESLWTQIEMYERIKQLYERLKVHDKMQREFIDIAAHELRTPIQPILGLAEVLRDQISSPDDQSKKLLEAIIRNAKRLQQLQEDILDVARIESRSLRLDVERFNLNEVLLHIIDDFRSQTNEKVELLYKADGDISIRADRSRLAQVVSNLVSNAVKFTKEGTIHLNAKRVADKIIISVKDSGSGIDPEILPRLFTKFATKSERGTGLGLFISKSIVESHGGTIRAENNKDGKGATFTFTLPLGESWE